MGAQSPDQNTNPNANQGQQQQYQQQAARYDDLNTINDLFGGGLSSFDSNGAISEVSEVLKAIHEKNKEDARFKGVKFIAIGAEETGNFGAIALVKSVADSMGVGVYVYTLLVEKSKDTPITVQPITINGVTIEPFIGVADAYKSSYFNTVSRAVCRNLNIKNPEQQVMDAGHSIIYDVTAISERGLAPLVLQGLKAITHVMDLGNSQRNIFNLTRVVNNPAIRIGTKVTLDQELKSANGLPTRADITSELYFSEYRPGGPGDVGDTRESSVVRISSFTDLIFLPQNVQPIATPYGPMTRPAYIPRIMITNWEAKYPVSNTEFMLLAIASMTSLIRNRGYGISWRSHYDAQQNKDRNLGAVGYQIPGLTEDGQPGKIDTTSFTDLSELMNRVLVAEPVITMAIPQGGAGDWSVDLIAAAGEGGEAGQIATEHLFRAADNLCNGRFSPIYAEVASAAGVPNTRIAVEYRNEMGYLGYQHRDGKLVDVNETDLLAILNKTVDKDPQLVEDYLLALYGNDHERIRLDRLKNILERAGTDVRIKAYTRKFNFNAVFISALAKAIAACGLTINNSSLLQNPDRNVYTQTVQDWQANMINPNAVQGMFQQQQQVNQGQYGFASPFRGTNFYQQ